MIIYSVQDRKSLLHSLLIYMYTAAQFAEILWIGARLSLCFTVRKEKACIPRRNVQGKTTSVAWSCSWPCA